VSGCTIVNKSRQATTSRLKNKGNTGGVVRRLGTDLTNYVTGELFAEEQILGRQWCARSKVDRNSRKMSESTASAV
jgi:hypothetical protein